MSISAPCSRPTRGRARVGSVAGQLVSIARDDAVSWSVAADRLRGTRS